MEYTRLPLNICFPPPPFLTRRHHSDIGNNYNPVPDKDDSPYLIAARELELAYLRQWVADFHAERASAKAFLARNERAFG